MKTIGILGGMGPEATNLLCRLITGYTPAKSDQEHIPVICYNNAAIASRVGAGRGIGLSPLPELIRTARVLEQAGADFLLMPCNTAHIYFDMIQAAIQIELLNMVDLTAKTLADIQPDIRVAGLLATTSTVDSMIYHRSLANKNIKTVAPVAAVQNSLVMDAIYGRDGIKAGGNIEAKKQLQEASSLLVRQGVDCIIAGCTEISIALEQRDIDIPLVDPLKIMAKIAVERALLPKNRFNTDTSLLSTAS